MVTNLGLYYKNVRPTYGLNNGVTTSDCHAPSQKQGEVGEYILGFAFPGPNPREHSSKARSHIYLQTKDWLTSLLASVILRLGVL